jgi:hypothetical protein
VLTSGANDGVACLARGDLEGGWKWAREMDRGGGRKCWLETLKGPARSSFRLWDELPVSCQWGGRRKHVGALGAVLEAVCRGMQGVVLRDDVEVQRVQVRAEGVL